MSATGDVVRLVNEIRRADGLHPLKGHSKLARAALRRARRLAAAGRMDSHRGWLTALKAVRFPLSRHKVGENIAQGQDRAAEVMKDWMDSPGHKANILNPRYRYIGVAVAEGYGDRFWVQEFSDR